MAKKNWKDEPATLEQGRKVFATMVTKFGVTRGRLQLKKINELYGWGLRSVSFDDLTRGQAHRIIEEHGESTTETMQGIAWYDNRGNGGKVEWVNVSVGDEMNLVELFNEFLHVEQDQYDYDTPDGSIAVGVKVEAWDGGIKIERLEETNDKE